MKTYYDYKIIKGLSNNKMLTGLTAHLESKYPRYSFSACSIESKPRQGQGIYAFDLNVKSFVGPISKEERNQILLCSREYIPWRNIVNLVGSIPLIYESVTDNANLYRETFYLGSIPDEEFNLLIQKDLFL